ASSSSAKPIGDIISRLFDHLVGTGEQRRRHREAKRLSSLEIDRQFILRWRLHGQVGGLLTLENAVDIAGRAAERIDHYGPVADQAAAGGEVAVGIDCG